MQEDDINNQRLLVHGSMECASEHAQTNTVNVDPSNPYRCRCRSTQVGIQAPEYSTDKQVANGTNTIHRRWNSYKAQ